MTPICCSMVVNLTDSRTFLLQFVMLGQGMKPPCTQLKEFWFFVVFDLFFAGVFRSIAAGARMLKALPIRRNVRRAATLVSDIRCLKPATWQQKTACLFSRWGLERGSRERTFLLEAKAENLANPEPLIVRPCSEFGGSPEKIRKKIYRYLAA